MEEEQLLAVDRRSRKLYRLDFGSANVTGEDLGTFPSGLSDPQSVEQFNDDLLCGDGSGQLWLIDPDTPSSSTLLGKIGVNGTALSSNAKITGLTAFGGKLYALLPDQGTAGRIYEVNRTSVTSSSIHANLPGTARVNWSGLSNRSGSFLLIESGRGTQIRSFSTQMANLGTLSRAVRDPTGFTYWDGGYYLIDSGRTGGVNRLNEVLFNSDGTLDDVSNEGRIVDVDDEDTNLNVILTGLASYTPPVSATHQIRGAVTIPVSVSGKVSKVEPTTHQIRGAVTIPVSVSGKVTKAGPQTHSIRGSVTIPVSVSGRVRKVPKPTDPVDPPVDPPVTPVEPTAERYDRLVSVKVYKASTFGVDDEIDGIRPVDPDDPEKTLDNDLRYYLSGFNEKFTLDEADSLTLDIYIGSVWHHQNLIQARDRIVIRRTASPEYDTDDYDASQDTYRLYRVRSVEIGTGNSNGLLIKAWSIDYDLTKHVFRFVNRSGHLNTDRNRSLRSHDFGRITVREVLENIFGISCSLPPNFKLGSIYKREADEENKITEFDVGTLEVFPFFQNTTIADCLGILNREVRRHDTLLEYEVFYNHVETDDHDAGDIIFNFVESRGASVDEEKTGNYLMDMDKREIVAEPATYWGNRVAAQAVNIQDDYVSRVIPYVSESGFDIGIAGTSWEVKSKVYNSGRQETTLVLEDYCIGFNDQFNYLDRESRTSSWGVRDSSDDIVGQLDKFVQIELQEVTGNGLIWQNMSAGAGYQKDWQIPSGLVQGGGVAFLKSLLITGTYEITLTIGGQNYADPSPDLSDVWEKAPDAVVLKVPSRNLFITLPGPASDQANTRDSRAPYTWTLKGEKASEFQAFVDAWRTSHGENPIIDTSIALQEIETPSEDDETYYRIQKTALETNTIVVSGEFTGTHVSFVEECGEGDDAFWQALDYLRKPIDEYEQGSVIESREITDASPWDNLIEREGHDANFDEYDGGAGPIHTFPRGWEAYSITEGRDLQVDGLAEPLPRVEPSDQFAKNGRQTVKVFCTSRKMGIKIPINFRGRLDGNYVSAFITLHVERGVVGVYLEDAEGNVFPGEGDDKIRASAGSDTSGLRLEGFEPVPGKGYLYIESQGIDSRLAATFYLDSVSVTPSATAWEHQPYMGPKDLWRAGIEYLREIGGIKPYTTQTEIIDITRWFSDLLEIKVGSWVRLLDCVEHGSNGTRSYHLRLEGRVERISDSTQFGSNFDGAFNKVATIGRQRVNAAHEFLKDFPGRVPTPELPPLQDRPEIDVDVSALFDLLRGFFRTWQEGAGTTREGFLRFAPPPEETDPEIVAANRAAFSTVSKFEVVKAIDGASLPIPEMEVWEEVAKGAGTPGKYETSISLNPKHLSWMRVRVTIQSDHKMLDEFVFDYDENPEIRDLQLDWLLVTREVVISWIADEDTAGCVYAFNNTGVLNLNDAAYKAAIEASQFVNGNGRQEVKIKPNFLNQSPASGLLPGQTIHVGVRPFSKAVSTSTSETADTGTDVTATLRVPKTADQPLYYIEHSKSGSIVKVVLVIVSDPANLVQSVTARTALGRPLMPTDTATTIAKVTTTAGDTYPVNVDLSTGDGIHKHTSYVQYSILTPQGIDDILIDPFPIDRDVQPEGNVTWGLNWIQASQKYELVAGWVTDDDTQSLKLECVIDGTTYTPTLSTGLLPYPNASAGQITVYNEIDPDTAFTFIATAYTENYVSSFTGTSREILRIDGRTPPRQDATDLGAGILTWQAVVNGEARGYIRYTPPIPDRVSRFRVFKSSGRPLPATIADDQWEAITAHMDGYYETYVVLANSGLSWIRYEIQIDEGESSDIVGEVHFDYDQTPEIINIDLDWNPVDRKATVSLRTDEDTKGTVIAWNKSGATGLNISAFQAGIDASPSQHVNGTGRLSYTIDEELLPGQTIYVGLLPFSVAIDASTQATAPTAGVPYIASLRVPLTGEEPKYSLAVTKAGTMVSVILTILERGAYFSKVQQRHSLGRVLSASDTYADVTGVSDVYTTTIDVKDQHKHSSYVQYAIRTIAGVDDVILLPTQIDADIQPEAVVTHDQNWIEATKRWELRAGWSGDDDFKSAKFELWVSADATTDPDTTAAATVTSNTDALQGQMAIKNDLESDKKWVFKVTAYSDLTADRGSATREKVVYEINGKTPVRPDSLGEGFRTWQANGEGYCSYDPPDPTRITRVRAYWDINGLPEPGTEDATRWQTLTLRDGPISSKNVSLAADTVVSDTVPAGANKVRLTAIRSLRYTTDGTNPSATVGTVLAADGTVDVTVSAGDTLKFFETGGATTVTVQYLNTESQVYVTNTLLALKRLTFLRMEIQVDMGSDDDFVREFTFDADSNPNIRWSASEYLPGSSGCRLKFYADEDCARAVIFASVYNTGDASDKEVEEPAQHEAAQGQRQQGQSQAPPPITDDTEPRPAGSITQAFYNADITNDGNEQTIQFGAVSSEVTPGVRGTLIVTPGQTVAFTITPYSNAILGRAKNMRGPTHYSFLEVPETGEEALFSTNLEIGPLKSTDANYTANRNKTLVWRRLDNQGTPIQATITYRPTNTKRNIAAGSAPTGTDYKKTTYLYYDPDVVTNLATIRATTEPSTATSGNRVVVAVGWPSESGTDVSFISAIDNPADVNTFVEFSKSLSDLANISGQFRGVHTINNAGSFLLWGADLDEDGNRPATPIAGSGFIDRTGLNFGDGTSITYKILADANDLKFQYGSSDRLKIAKDVTNVGVYNGPFDIIGSIRSGGALRVNSYMILGSGAVTASGGEITAEGSRDGSTVLGVTGATKLGGSVEITGTLKLGMEDPISSWSEIAASLTADSLLGLIEASTPITITKTTEGKVLFGIGLLQGDGWTLNETVFTTVQSNLLNVDMSLDPATKTIDLQRFPIGLSQMTTRSESVDHNTEVVHIEPDSSGGMLIVETQPKLTVVIESTSNATWNPTTRVLTLK